jgi:major membrane immunogen (membrane-anchored lipoprotein)
MSKEPGQIAYEAFMDESDWPYDFSDVDGKVKAAWAAAEAAVRADATRGMVEALEWYASNEAWTVDQLEGSNGDYGNRARAALEKARR